MSKKKLLQLLKWADDKTYSTKYQCTAWPSIITHARTHAHTQNQLLIVERDLKAEGVVAEYQKVPWVSVPQFLIHFETKP